MTSNPPALQLYTVREQLAADRSGTLRQIAAMGYRAVEPFNVLDDTDGLAADLAAAGLVACSVHAAPTDGQADAVIQAARTLGTDTVIVPYVPPADLAGPDGVAAVAGELNAMATRLAPHGLRLGYHNHDFELATIVHGRPALEVLAGALDDSVLLEVDTYWAAVGGQDVPALLGRLGDRVRYLHVKDGPVTKDDPMTAVGAGQMPIAEILAAGRAVEWHVVELDRCATDMMAAVAASLAFLAGSSGAASAGISTPGRGAAGEAGHG